MTLKNRFKELLKQLVFKIEYEKNKCLNIKHNLLGLLLIIENDSFATQSLKLLLAKHNKPLLLKYIQQLNQHHVINTNIACWLLLCGFFNSYKLYIHLHILIDSLKITIIKSMLMVINYCCLIFNINIAFKMYDLSFYKVLTLEIPDVLITLDGKNVGPTIIKTASYNIFTSDKPLLTSLQAKSEKIHSLIRINYQRNKNHFINFSEECELFSYNTQITIIGNKNYKLDKTKKIHLKNLKYRFFNDANEKVFVSDINYNATEHYIGNIGSVKSRNYRTVRIVKKFGVTKSLNHYDDFIVETHIQDSHVVNTGVLKYGIFNLSNVAHTWSFKHTTSDKITNSDENLITNIEKTTLLSIIHLFFHKVKPIILDNDFIDNTTKKIVPNTEFAHRLGITKLLSKLHTKFLTIFADVYHDTISIRYVNKHFYSDIMSYIFHEFIGSTTSLYLINYNNNHNAIVSLLKNFGWLKTLLVYEMFKCLKQQNSNVLITNISVNMTPIDNSNNVNNDEEIKNGSSPISNSQDKVVDLAKYREGKQEI